MMAYGPMNKNLEDLKSRRYRDGNYEIAFRYCLIKVLEDFEKKLNKLERKEAGPKIRLIKELPKSGKRDTARNRERRGKNQNVI